FSAGVREANGISVRTPISRATSFINDHINAFQLATAPSSMLKRSSGTSVDSSTVQTTPVPSQVGHAPWLLKASSSADGGSKTASQTGQTNDFPLATSKLGSKTCP